MDDPDFYRPVPQKWSFWLPVLLPLLLGLVVAVASKCLGDDRFRQWIEAQVSVSSTQVTLVQLPGKHKCERQLASCYRASGMMAGPSGDRPGTGGL